MGEAFCALDRKAYYHNDDYLSQNYLQIICKFKQDLYGGKGLKNSQDKRTRQQERSRGLALC